MTLDAGKCCGPKGIGVLVHRPVVKLSPVLLGGSQESGLRPGTENVSAIVGAAKAITMAQSDQKMRSEKVAALRDEFMDMLLSIEGVVVNGSLDSRLANNVNISIVGIDTEYAVVVLDAKDIAASTRSACSGADGSGSHVVLAMTNDAARAASTIRFSLGEDTTKQELVKVAEALRKHVLDTKSFQSKLGKETS